MPNVGETVGSYELVRKLGAGAFGEVWLARHIELGFERAMKIPTDSDYIQQLRKEGQIQFTLKHPNIVETFDLDTHHATPHLVMEYVEGEDLRKRLRARGKLPPTEALPIVRQILDALHAAHAQGIVHHDLKPENILLAADGTVKVADFGLGRVQATVAQSLLLSGSMVSREGKSVSGTFEYMSPEQQRGEPADPRDDLYALGVIGCLTVIVIGVLLVATLRVNGIPFREWLFNKSKSSPEQPPTPKQPPVLRWRGLPSSSSLDRRLSISVDWSTQDADVDLIVVEPDGTTSRLRRSSRRIPPRETWSTEDARPGRYEVSVQYCEGCTVPTTVSLDVVLHGKRPESPAPPRILRPGSRETIAFVEVR